MKTKSPLPKQNSNNKDLMRYAGLASQLAVSLGVAVWLGYKADDWLGMSFPVLVWVLPFVVLCLLIYKLIQETSKKKQDDA